MPSDLPGCVLWLRADIGITLSSGNVAAWSDQSPNGNNFTAAGAAQPTYNAAPINGRPTVRFNGTSSSMACANNVATGVPSAIIAVFSTAANVGGIEALLVTQKLGLYKVLAVSPNRWGVQLGVSMLDDTVPTAAGQCLIANQHAANNVDLIRNGTVSNQTSGTGTASRSGTALGSDPTLVQFAEMDLAELVLVSSDLQADALARLRSYFTSLYGFAA